MSKNPQKKVTISKINRIIIEYNLSEYDDKRATYKILGRHRRKSKGGKTMLTQDVVIETVRNYARDIEAHGVRLHTVFLYGSFAKGTQHEHSDIDVALVADEFIGFAFEDAKLFPYVGIKSHTLG